MRIIVAAFLLLACASSCRMRTGSGNVISKTVNVGSFTGIRVSGPFQVEVRTGAIEPVRIEADDNLIDDIKVRGEGDMLVIEMKGHMNLRNATLKIKVSMPELHNMEASAAAHVILNDQVHSDRMKFNASSASHIEGNIDAPEVELHASSGAKIDMEGRSRLVDAQVSSGASIHASTLMAEKTKASASSGGTAEVHASTELNASASSGGSVRYAGGAMNVVKDVSSGGSVSKMN